MIPGLPPRPRTADLSGQPLTLEQMAHLGGQATLVGLRLDDCPIGDEHVRALAAPPKLVNLSLNGTQVTDAALEHLARLPRLQLLFLDRTRIRGDGLRHLAKSASLEVLWLCATDVTDQTIGAAAGIPALSTLRIAKTRVTREGLLSLAASERLKVVADGQLSDADVAEFEAAQRESAARARGEQRPPPGDEAAARQVLLAFFEELTVWERSMTAVVAKGLPVGAPEHQEPCAAIFGRHGTEAARKAGVPRGFSEPPEHEGETVVDARSEAKAKLWLYTKGRVGQSRYLLTRTAAGWRVDRRQWKSRGWEKRGL